MWRIIWAARVSRRTVLGFVDRENGWWDGGRLDRLAMDDLA
jgi:hypothetical protein